MVAGCIRLPLMYSVERLSWWEEKVASAGQQAPAFLEKNKHDSFQKITG